MKYCECGNTEPREVTTGSGKTAIICKNCGRSIAEKKLVISDETRKEIDEIWRNGDVEFAPTGNEFFKQPPRVKYTPVQDNSYKMKYFMVDGDKDFGVVSIMTRMYDDAGKTRVHYTVSICSPKDNFNKSIARELCNNDSFFDGDVELQGGIFDVVDKVNSTYESQTYQRFPMRYEMINKVILFDFMSYPRIVDRLPDFAIKILLNNI